MRWTVSLLIAGALAASGAARATEPLMLEAKIPLGEVTGRIDHFGFDAGGQRLFVAELGNNTVGVIDLKTQKLVRTITGLKEPQGVGYAGNTLFVANAGDGSIQLFSADLSPSGRIDLGDDADNIRVDGNRVYVGYGSGAIAVIDAATHAKVGEIKLKAHPESFQLDPASSRIYVNVPDAGEVAVLDKEAGKQVASWSLQKAGANFPMAIDHDGGLVVVATRQPPRLLAFAPDGSAVADEPLCSDADDIFVDAKRRRIYVSCGQGVVEVFERQTSGYASLGRVQTVSGARTGYFLSDADRLFVAVRASGGEPAALWVFRPTP
jgi:YVTN family beta-propeller protein